MRSTAHAPDATRAAQTLRGTRTARNTGAADASPAAPAPSSREDQVRALAYALYESRGCEAGHELEDWLQAEAQLDGKPAPAGLAAH